MTSCPRCGETLPEHANFCPHCGAQQLYLYTGEEDAAETANSSGVPPPPKPGLVDWGAALTCVAIVGGVALVIFLASANFSLLKLLSWLWVLGASQIALDLYRRRRPQARMDAVVGVRIGSVVGVTIVGCLLAAAAIAGMMKRYVWHGLTQFDAQYAQMVHDSMQRAAMQAGKPLPPQMAGLMISPEFQAGFVLLALSMAAIGILLLSVIGGAFAGFLSQRRVAR